MKYIILGLLLAISVRSNAETPADTLINYDIIGEANMFMCPFLSPKYINFLKDECNCEVVKTPDLIIHLYNSVQLNNEKLLKKAEEIGYERKNITIKKLN
jgi:hypothetical protein